MTHSPTSDGGEEVAPPILYDGNMRVEIVASNKGLSWVKSTMGDFGHHVVGTHLLTSALAAPSPAPEVGEEARVDRVPEHAHEHLRTAWDALLREIETLQRATNYDPHPDDEVSVSLTIAQAGALEAAADAALTANPISPTPAIRAAFVAGVDWKHTNPMAGDVMMLGAAGEYVVNIARLDKAGGEGG